MKKIFVLGTLVMLLAVAASAQGRDGVRRQRIERGFNSGQLTRPEKFRLQRNEVHYRTEKRRALRDGRLDRHERRSLHKMRRHERREAFRLRHNGRRRLL